MRQKRDDRPRLPAEWIALVHHQISKVGPVKKNTPIGKRAAPLSANALGCDTDLADATQAEATDATNAESTAAKVRVVLSLE